MSQLIDPEVFREAALGTPEYMRNLTHPDLKTIRNKVVKSLAAEMDATLLGLGYERKGNEWRKASTFGRSILQLQRDRYGFCLFINVGAERTTVPDSFLLRLLKAFCVRYLGASPPTMQSSMSGTPDGFILKRFCEFCPELSQRYYETDSFYYLRLHESQELMNALVTVIRRRLIPWIEVCHDASSDELPRPADMTWVPLLRMDGAQPGSASWSAPQ